MVAEVSAPSHGVGIELGWAIARSELAKYPILCLKQKDSKYKTSALIGGCDKINYVEYSTEDDAI